MIIETFCSADFTVQNESGTLSVIPTSDQIIVPSFPFIHPAIIIVIKMRLTKYEVGKHKMELKFKEPDGTEFSQEVKGDLDVPIAPDEDFAVINPILN